MSEGYSVLRIDSNSIAAYDKSKDDADSIASRWEGCGIRCKVMLNSELPPDAIR